MKTLLILFVLMNLDKLLKTGDCTETEDEVLSITPKTQEHVDLLKNVSTQYETALWQPVSPHYITEETEVHLFVPGSSSETVKDLLEKNAMTHTVLLANAKELIKMQTRNDSDDYRSSPTFYERYHSLEDIYYWINRTQQENPDTVKTIFIGSSYEKRPLYVLKLSLNSRPNKKAMWIDCGIHAREWISPAFCLWFVQYSLSFYKINSDITDILDNMDVYILPVMNPDGYKVTWTTNRMWRKNRSLSNSSQCIGVDLNRNFDANWCTEGASDDPCTETYCGTFPESEPESKAVANFLRSHKDTVQLYLSIHSYSQMLLFPYSCTLEEAENHKDLLEMAQEAAQSIGRYHNNTYNYGPGAKTIYLAPGGSDDWAYNLGIKYSFTFELQDRGRYGFLLPPSSISGACNEALIAVKTIALKTSIISSLDPDTMKNLLILFVLMNLDKLLKTGDCTETEDEILSITPKTQEQVDLLKNVSTQYETALWQPVSPHYITEETEVHLFVPGNSSKTVKDLLEKNAMTHTVLLANAKELIEMQTRNESADPRSSATFYERYHSLEDIYYWINRTQQENPDTVKTILIGSSYEKRPLYVLKLSLNSRPNKKAMWIDCGIHAREWISPAFCLWFVQYSLAFYKINSDITDILDNMDVYILPVMNPDGYKVTWTTNRMWRKNRSLSDTSKCVGVDLNRNFDANWCTEGASDDPCTEIYCGAFPESEPESEAVANFLRSHKDTVQLYLSIHSYSQMLLFPYSCTLEEAENHKDLFEMAQEAAQKIRRYYRNTYKYGPGAKTIYLAPGGSDDWAYNLGIKYSFTFELQDRGRYGFLLPPSSISGACNEALIAVKTIALKVIEKTQAPTSSPRAA